MFARQVYLYRASQATPRIKHPAQTSSPNQPCTFTPPAGMDVIPPTTRFNPRLPTGTNWLPHS